MCLVYLRKGPYANVIEQSEHREQWYNTRLEVHVSSVSSLTFLSPVSPSVKWSW